MQKFIIIKKRTIITKKIGPLVPRVTHNYKQTVYLFDKEIPTRIIQAKKTRMKDIWFQVSRHYEKIKMHVYYIIVPIYGL